MTDTRRKFIKKIAAAGMMAPFAAQANAFNHNDEPLEVHVFSKHLQFLDYKESTEVAAEIGFSGLDLTVRPKGHVLPENVKSDLPKAIGEIKNTGLSCKMITTAIADVANTLDVDIIQTAGTEGVNFYRSNWFNYKENMSLEKSLDYYKEKVRQLGEMNKKHNIVGCYQNHSGTKIGASVWAVKRILETTDPKFFGSQYDIRHAVAEGGRSWPNGVRLLKDHIKVIALKDFKWGKVNGKWQTVNVPIGEGMVDFKAYFKLLKKLELKPPASLHFEYPLGGANKGHYEITIDRKIVFDAMKRDLNAVQTLWKEA